MLCVMLIDSFVREARLGLNDGISFNKGKKGFMCLNIED